MHRHRRRPINHLRHRLTLDLDLSTLDVDVVIVDRRSEGYTSLLAPAILLDLSL